MPAFGLAAPDSWLERWFVLLEALPDVKWVETGFLTREQLPHLARRLRETGVSWGIHFPLLKTDGWESILQEGHSPAKRRRLRSMIRENFTLGAEMGAAYINLHLPFYMRGVPDRDFRDLLQEEVAFWAGLSRENGLAVRLENARLRPGIFETPEDFNDLCHRHGFRLCLDPGHLLSQVAERRFQADHVFKFIETAAPYVSTVHVYQFRAEDITIGDGQAEVIRCPALPHLGPDGGWMDLPALLRPVVMANPDCLMILEHGYGHGAAALRGEIEWLRAGLEMTGAKVAK